MKDYLQAFLEGEACADKQRGPTDRTDNRPSVSSVSEPLPSLREKGRASRRCPLPLASRMVCPAAIRFVHVRPVGNANFGCRASERLRVLLAIRHLGSKMCPAGSYPLSPYNSA
jgi:hypothetical protein